MKPCKQCLSVFLFLMWSSLIPFSSSLSFFFSFLEHLSFSKSMFFQEYTCCWVLVISEAGRMTRSRALLQRTWVKNKDIIMIFVAIFSTIIFLLHRFLQQGDLVYWCLLEDSTYKFLENYLQHVGSIDKYRSPRWFQESMAMVWLLVRCHICGYQACKMAKIWPIYI